MLRWVLKRLVAEAEADLADLYTDAGDLKPIDEWPEIWRPGARCQVLRSRRCSRA